jgi:AcrR family transcriptional regulator
MASSSAAVARPAATGQRADARRNRRRILDAGRELFAEHGFDAQIDQIARRAGVGVGTVYRHFPTKEDLLQALIDARFEALAEAAREGLANPDPWAGFAGFMRYSAEGMAGDRALSEAMGERREMMRAAAERVGLPDLDRQLVERAQAVGELRPEVVWEDIPGLVCGMGRAIVEGKVGPLAMSWERYLAIVLDGLRAPGATTLPD